jgi:D-alanine-D-alanine ligase
MSRKIRVGIVFGGRSVEHEISLLSAKNVFAALDKTKFEPVLIGITKTGQWLLQKNSSLLAAKPNAKTIALAKSETEITPTSLGQSIDVVFPVLHGTFGEDGTIQGLLKLAGIPFVGAGVLGSAVGVDKDVQKRLLRDAAIPVANFVVISSHQPLVTSRSFGFPVFVKPANCGSSVGISKAHNQKELDTAIREAFRFDTKVLIEEAIVGRELECSVLGNENPTASTVGEVVATHEFYDYDAKYIDEKGAKLILPAKLSLKELKAAQKTAIDAYTTLCCEGMARVDMFLTKNGRVLVNEINTIPGFTNISMYPKLWEASGVSQTELISKLISLAIERFKKEQKLKTNVL